MRMNERLGRCVLLLLMLVVFIGGVQERVFGEDAKTEVKSFEQWYVMMMGGQRTGWTRAERKMDEGLVRTDTEMSMKVKRGPSELHIQLEQVFWEDVSGKPRKASIVFNMGGGLAMKAQYRFEDDAVVQVTNQLGNDVEKRLPALPEDILGLAAMERQMEAAWKRGESTIKGRTVDVSMGVTIVEAEMTKVGEEVIEVYGRSVPAIVWDVKASNLGGLVMRQYMDEEGKALKMRVPLGAGLDVEMIAADKALALSDLEAPEVMANTLIKPEKGSVKVRDIRKTKNAVYELRFDEVEGLDLDLPRTGTQKVVWGDEKRARVIVNVEEMNNPIDDLPTENDLAETAMLQWKDEKVQSLIRQALGEDMGKGLSDKEKASKLRKFVNDFIDEKSLAVGFASAAEIARTKQGDCSEHATLLAAMLRGVEIPSRTVSGLMYIDKFLGKDNVLGYHMWTMAWIEEEDGGGWMDFDAVLADRDYDAGHIALAASSMNESEMSNDLVAMLPIMGNVKVKVVRMK
ncbi:transglutaminase domain-containing protein [Planctomycetota bacterium]|nr:transglutaminase domain-containing protein [Planctomycetota bacterium]